MLVLGRVIFIRLQFAKALFLWRTSSVCFQWLEGWMSDIGRLLELIIYVPITFYSQPKLRCCSPPRIHSTFSCWLAGKKCFLDKPMLPGKSFWVLVMSSNPLLAGDHYIYCSWKPNDPCFDWKSEFGPCFGGLAFKNRGHFFGIPGICKV